MTAQLLHGDCRQVIATLPDCSVDSIVTDPPYELGFMGKKWDASGVAYDVTLWRECLRVLKPGGHLLAFGGTRTYHRMAVAIEDAGFEIRDSIHWLYGSGFPKSLDVSKAIDKAADAEREAVGPSYKVPNARAVNPHFVAIADRLDDLPESIDYAPTAPATDLARQWEGWGTALKPAHEPIVVARKPLAGTVVANVTEFGTGALNIDGCRVGSGGGTTRGKGGGVLSAQGAFTTGHEVIAVNAGRWPANLVLDDLIAEAHPEWANFFYVAKPSRRERNAGAETNIHPTVKPLTLMRWLVRLVTPPDGTVLEPFAGSGTTLMAAILEGFDVIGVELTADYLPIIEGRVAWAQAQGATPAPTTLTLFDEETAA